MSDSFAYTAILKAAENIQKVSSNIRYNSGPAADALMSLATTLSSTAHDIELHRADSILKGTHPALQPVKRLAALSNQSLDFTWVKPVLAEDEPFIDEKQVNGPRERWFQRFLGEMFRGLYGMRGIEDQAMAHSLLSANLGRENAPRHFTIEDGNMVLSWRDGAFEHKLTLDKNYSVHGVRQNKYEVRSLWMNETIQLGLSELGWFWLNQNLIESFKQAYKFGDEEIKGVDEQTLREKIFAIADIDCLTFLNNVTFTFPGIEAQRLPECRIVASVHYYLGTGEHRLNIAAHPASDHAYRLLGTTSLGGSQGLKWDYMPTGMQKWLLENIEAPFKEAIEKRKAEALGESGE